MAKSWIHPQYYDEVEVSCICGHTFMVSAADKGPIRVETCPNCSPVYTGKKETKVIKGRMEKFLEKQKRIDMAKAA